MVAVKSSLIAVTVLVPPPALVEMKRRAPGLPPESSRPADPPPGGVTLNDQFKNSPSLKVPPIPSRVAVAVATVSPGGSGKLNGGIVAVQLALVVTTVEPRKCFPSPKPDEWHAGLEKNSTRKFVLATLSNVPDTITFPPPQVAEITGWFCRSFGPGPGLQWTMGSTQLGSPSYSRSIPRLAFEKKELPRIALLMAALLCTQIPVKKGLLHIRLAPPLKAMMLRALVAVPPTVLS
jgi:hypothetical protein